MARRLDTNWRDGKLALRSHTWGFEVPGPGLKLPMIEYDRGVPVAVISYQRRGEQLPSGDSSWSTYEALSALYSPDGKHLPFFTAQYDPRNWAFRLFPHNSSARIFLDGTGWRGMSEYQFVNALYRLRERWMPDLEPYGVKFMRDPWILTEPSPDAFRGVARLRGEATGPEPYPLADMSKRRREYEPVEQVRATWRNPCVDLDFVAANRNNRVAVVVDYKGPGAKINLSSTNVRALSSLYTKPHCYDWVPVPMYVAQYDSQPDMWKVRVHCANQSARLHLSYVLGSLSTDVDTLASIVADAEWIDLNEAEWKAVLYAAQQL